jgi:Transposase, Mutator family
LCGSTFARTNGCAEPVRSLAAAWLMTFVSSRVVPHPWCTRACDGDDDHRVGRPPAPETAEHRREVLLAAVRRRGHEDERVGGARYLGLGATGRTSRSTSTRRPSRCCAPGASTPTASPRLVGLVVLAGPASESAESWRGFLEGLTDRGLGDPLSSSPTAPPGLMAAIEQVFARSLRQRCVIHHLRNAVAKVSRAEQDVFKGSAPTPQRSAASSRTSNPSPCTFGSRWSTGSGAGTPT